MQTRACRVSGPLEAGDEVALTGSIRHRVRVSSYLKKFTVVTIWLSNYFGYEMSLKIHVVYLYMPNSPKCKSFY